MSMLIKLINSQNCFVRVHPSGYSTMCICLYAEGREKRWGVFAHTLKIAMKSLVNASLEFVLIFKRLHQE